MVVIKKEEDRALAVKFEMLQNEVEAAHGNYAQLSQATERLEAFVASVPKEKTREFWRAVGHLQLKRAQAGYARKSAYMSKALNTKFNLLRQVLDPSKPGTMRSPFLL